MIIKNLCLHLQGSDYQSVTPVKSSDESDTEGRSESTDDEVEDVASQDTTKKIFKPAGSKRQQLSDSEAVEIFELRPRSKNNSVLRRGSMLLCKTIAPKYGVSPKTIRDIWRGRTWLHATEHLWTEEERRHKASKSKVARKGRLQSNPHCNGLEHIGLRCTLSPSCRTSPSYSPGYSATAAAASPCHRGNCWQPCRPEERGSSCDFPAFHAPSHILAAGYCPGPSSGGALAAQLPPVPFWAGLRIPAPVPTPPPSPARLAATDPALLFRLLAGLAGGTPSSGAAGMPALAALAAAAAWGLAPGPAGHGWAG